MSGTNCPSFMRPNCHWSRAMVRGGLRNPSRTVSVFAGSTDRAADRRWCRIAPHVVERSRSVGLVRRERGRHAPGDRLSLIERGRRIERHQPAAARNVELAIRPTPACSPGA